jgi:hypothetical protein
MSSDKTEQMNSKRLRARMPDDQGGGMSSGALRVIRVVLLAAPPLRDDSGHANQMTHARR